MKTITLILFFILTLPLFSQSKESKVWIDKNPQDSIYVYFAREHGVIADRYEIVLENDRMYFLFIPQPFYFAQSDISPDVLNQIKERIKKDNDENSR